VGHEDFCWVLCTADHAEIFPWKVTDLLISYEPFLRAWKISRRPTSTPSVANFSLRIMWISSVPTSRVTVGMANQDSYRSLVARRLPHCPCRQRLRHARVFYLPTSPQVTTSWIPAQVNPCLAGGDVRDVRTQASFGRVGAKVWFSKFSATDRPWFELVVTLNYRFCLQRRPIRDADAICGHGPPTSLRRQGRLCS
jgi:hypothetical protein